MRFRIIVSAFLAGLLAAVSCERPEDGPAPLELSLRNSNGGPSKDDVFVSVKYAGQWTLSVTGQDGAPIDWARLSVYSGSGENNGILLDYDANKTMEDRIVEVHARSDQGDEEVASFVQYWRETGRYHEDIMPEGWLELPEKKAGFGLEFYTHPMKVGSLSCRNYSFCYDRSKLVSWWVAYPLNDDLIGGGSRTDAWGYDPKLPETAQQRLNGGYRTSGYDRGHQLPSADRLSRVANIETFYFTNLTPQKSTFNQGMWGSLEDKVRVWGRAMDTLYVVTGCQVERPLGYALDNDRVEVAIPSSYWKALVGYKKNPTYGAQSRTGGYTGVAFWYNHDNAEKDWTKGQMTIDELEEKLGYDLFVNLPAKIGADKAAIVESTAETWWKTYVNK